MELKRLMPFNFYFHMFIAAVAQEAENQRDELKRQRSSYLKKTSLLRQELKMLKDQRKDLHSGGAAPPSPTTKGFIDENEKLQVCRTMTKCIMLLIFYYFYF